MRKGVKPNLSREWIFASRTYVTLAPEVGKDTLPKLNAERGWLGYFVGCESESVYKIFSPEKHRVFRVNTARVDNGEGTDDVHEGSTLSDRVPVPEDLNLENTQPSTDSEGDTSGHDSDDDGEHGIDDEYENDMGDIYDATPRQSPRSVPLDEANLPMNVESLDLSDNDQEQPVDKEDTDRQIINDHQTDQNHDTSNDSSAAEEQEHQEPVVKSRFFAGVTTREKKGNKSHFFPNKAKIEEEEQEDEDDEYEDADDEGDYEESSKIKSQPAPKEKKKYPANRKPRYKASEEGMLINSPPCRRCYSNGFRCARVSVEDDCEQCKKGGHKCKYNLDGIIPKPERQRRRKEAISKVQDLEMIYIEVRNRERLQVMKDQKLPFEERCTAYNRRGRTGYNGEVPYQYCIKHKHLCVKEKRRNEVYCNNCNIAFCDKERPCGSCKRRGTKYCIYIDQDGLVKRAYIIRNPEDEGDADDEESEEECIACTQNNRVCNGGTPYYRYVKYRKDDDTYRSCTYKKSGGIEERYTTGTHMLDDEGNVILRENWEERAWKVALKPYQARKSRT